MDQQRPIPSSLGWHANAWSNWQTFSFNCVSLDIYHGTIMFVSSPPFPYIPNEEQGCLERAHTYLVPSMNIPAPLSQGSNAFLSLTMSATCSRDSEQEILSTGLFVPLIVRTRKKLLGPTRLQKKTHKLFPLISIFCQWVLFLGLELGWTAAELDRWNSLMDVWWTIWFPTLKQQDHFKSHRWH